MQAKISDDTDGEQIGKDKSIGRQSRIQREREREVHACCRRYPPNRLAALDFLYYMRKTKNIRGLVATSRDAVLACFNRRRVEPEPGRRELHYVVIVGRATSSCDRTERIGRHSHGWNTTVKSQRRVNWLGRCHICHMPGTHRLTNFPILYKNTNRIKRVMELE